MYEMFFCYVCGYMYTLIFYIMLFLECNISLDINEDEVTIKFTRFDGQVKYKLDNDASFETCM